MAENMGDILGKAMKRFLGKQNDEKEKKTVREGEETLKKTLNKMYEQYKDRVSPKPNYDEKYGAAEAVKPDLPNYRGDDALLKEAETEAEQAFKEKRAQAERSKIEAEEALSQKKNTAAKSYLERIASAEERAAKARANAEAKIAAQGLGNSTVSEGLRMQAEQYAENETKSAREQYINAVAAADLKIRAAEEKFADALNSFEIAEAAQAEKELKKLKKEREATLKTYAADYNSAIKDAEKAEKEKREGIAKDEKERDEAFLNRVESSGGVPYEGEEASEMENRYLVAHSFYSSVPKDRAKSLIVSSSEELKRLLGNYYERLLTSLNIK